MSRARSRTPLHSRNSDQNGRHRDGFYGGGQYQSNSWRGQEHVNKVESPENWDKCYSQEEDNVDHWAKFIEAIGRAGKEKPSPAPRYHTQEVGRRLEETPRRSHREAETPERNHRRNDQDANSHRNYSRGASPRTERGYWNEDHERGSSTMRSQKPNFKDQLHHERFRHSEPQEEYRGPHKGPRGAHTVAHDHRISTNYESRNRDSIKSMSRDPPMSQDHPRNRATHPRSRDHSRGRDPGVNPEHSRNRDLQRRSSSIMDREYSASTDLFMTREQSRNWNPPRRGGNHLKNNEPPMSRGPPRRPDFLRNKDGQSNMGNYFQEEENFRAASAGCKRPISQHGEQPRMKSHPRDSLISNVDFRMGDRRTGARGPQWEPERQPGQHRGDMQEPRNPKIPGAREDLSRHETLKIQVDMSHPVGQSRIISYLKTHVGQKEEYDRLMCTKKPSPSISSIKMWASSRRKLTESRVERLNCLGITGETFRGTSLIMDPSSLGESHPSRSWDRQLSLDLVNVGRQRLDFLPMLEHSGSHREAATHTGTFAQEIISLVHQVKENYFQGQGVPLNERFSNQQKYTEVDVEQFEDEELDDTGPIIKRPFASGSSDAQVFCKLGPFQSQKHLQLPGPGDLRFDLEQKRLQKLEGVKITISGNSQITPRELQENEHLYPGVDYQPDDSRTDRWSDVDRQHADRWDGPPAKRPAPNFNTRRTFNRFGPRAGPRGRRNPNVGTRW